MRKRLAPVLLALAVTACTQHDAADPVADISRSDLAGSYRYMRYFPEFSRCLFAWLDLTSNGSFHLYWGSVYGATPANGDCSPHETLARDPQAGGWEGEFANLGTYIAFEAVREYVVLDETGAREYYDDRTDLTGRYEPAAGSIAVVFADPWGFGESGGGSKAGGKEEGTQLSELLFVQN